MRRFFRSVKFIDASNSKKRARKVKGSDSNKLDAVADKQIKRQIAKLEERIKDLNQKAAENKNSLRLRELAEKKCEKLAAEIAQDKKRRAYLQRKLRDEVKERRIEKNEAKKQAARMLRDSQKLKYELNKVKETATKQAAVLRRKAAEAVMKQKQMAEQKRKRQRAESTRRGANTNVSKQKQDELIQWLEQELESISVVQETKIQIDEQNELLQSAIIVEQDILSSNDNESSSSCSALSTIRGEIKTRSDIIKQLQQSIADYKSQNNNSNGASPWNTFTDAMTWQNMSRVELNFLMAHILKHFATMKTDSENLHSNLSKRVAAAAAEATKNEKRRSEEEMINLRTQHSEAIMTLLESTNNALEQKVTLSTLESKHGVGINMDTQDNIDEMIKSYFAGCNKVREQVKEELAEVREKHDGMKKIVEQVAGSHTLKKKKKKPQQVEIEFDFEEEDSIIEDSGDSVL